MADKTKTRIRESKSGYRVTITRTLHPCGHEITHVLKDRNRDNAIKGATRLVDIATEGHRKNCKIGR